MSERDQYPTISYSLLWKFIVAYLVTEKNTEVRWANKQADKVLLLLDKSGRYEDGPQGHFLGSDFVQEIVENGVYESAFRGIPQFDKKRQVMLRAILQDLSTSLVSLPLEEVELVIG